MNLIICHYCQKEFNGRSNQKYCSTSCKSAINNIRIAKRNEPFKQIEQKIKANRRILIALENIYGNKELSQECISKSNINQNFNTGINVKNRVIEFYEYALKRLDNNNYIIFKTQ